MDNRKVQDFTADYISSFNDVLKPGLRNIAKNLRPAEFQVGTGEIVRVSIENLLIDKPKCSVKADRALYPWECRRMHLTYEGKVLTTVGLSINGGTKKTFQVPIGNVPIMVRSDICHLSNADASDFVKHNEEDDELGGYFIIKGNQCMLRYLVQTRRNFPIVSYKPLQAAGSDRTGHQVYMRCVRDDDTTSEMKIFWRTNTCPNLQLQIGKKTFQIPLPIVLKALQNKSALEMFNDVPKAAGDISLAENLTMMFSKFVASTEPQFISNISCLELLGSKFRDLLKIPIWLSNLEAGRRFIDDYVAIHVLDYRHKYEVLIMMLMKLHSFVNDGCCAESTDTLNFQEILTPGSLYKQVLRMALANYLSTLERNVMTSMASKRANTGIEDIIRGTLRETRKILNPVHYLLSTGSLSNSIIPGVKQNTGLRVLTDNINFYRLAANFRAFHRGAFFTTMKSSTIRRLLPESWGFVCPVHTPDGTPCGLLNHMSIDTRIQTAPASEEENSNLEKLVRTYIFDVDEFQTVTDVEKYICVMLNGRLLGYVHDARARNLANLLRNKKIFRGENPIPNVTEVVLKNISSTAAQFPGLYLFTTPGRMLRPVNNIMFGGAPTIEFIGTFEQTYLDIACRGGTLSEGGDIDLSVTHSELSPESLYSFTAGFTPYQNFNPSPRNLYQCQMSKQSMGYTYYTTRYRADNKLYCFLTPQIPMVRSKTYDEYDMKKRPLGYNPIVAVISYTGYDMEDAMVINVNSLQRGMGRCCIYKHYVIDLSPERGKTNESFLGCGNQVIEGLDSDGLPPIGMRLYPDKKSPLYAHYYEETHQVNIVKYKESEIGYVVNVSMNGSLSCATICIKLERNTDIGDKFSSRHGQKGVNSLKLPMIDLPVTEDGMTPDQLFNPHSFPSRMTMGMEMEFVSGKLAALTGKQKDCTAFQKGDIMADYIGDMVMLHYDGYGNERVSDGYRGRMIDSEVCVGMVYYQRLRHLVADKFQVRTIGKIDSITRQPVKGRKIGGGIRLGEMERDGLLSHGAVFCLQDRIIDCNSDKLTLCYCTSCNSFMHSYFRPAKQTSSWESHGDKAKSTNSWKCKLCENGTSQTGDLLRVQIPAVTRHLFHELATMNIRVKLTVAHIDGDAV